MHRSHGRTSFRSASSKSIAALDDDETPIDQLAFNPANGFAPLGITHARKDVYAASAANRKGRGVLSSDEARALLEAR